MGQLTDTLRATLLDLAQSDVRFYCGLHQEPESLSIKVLWELGKQRVITGLIKGRVPNQVDALLSRPDGPPLRSALPVKAAKGSKGGATTGKTVAKAGAAELHALGLRLDQLEQLVLLIARQVGVPPEAITQQATPPAPPPA